MMLFLGTYAPKLNPNKGIHARNRLKLVCSNFISTLYLLSPQNRSRQSKICVIILSLFYSPKEAMEVTDDMTVTTTTPLDHSPHIKSYLTLTVYISFDSITAYLYIYITEKIEGKADLIDIFPSRGGVGWQWLFLFSLSLTGRICLKWMRCPP